MKSLWIFLCVGTSAYRYFITNYICDENTYLSYRNEEGYEFSNSPFCNFCDDSIKDDVTEEDKNDDPMPTIDFTPFGPPPTEIPPDPDTPPSEIPTEPNPRGPTYTTPLPICVQENQTIDDQVLVWPESEKDCEAVSDPLCLDESLKIMRRTCLSDNIWGEAPSCTDIQQPINPCPPDLIPYNGRYCYTIIRKTKFPPECPYPGSIGWDEYAHLGLFTDEPFWMPLRRSDTSTHGIDVFRYTELTHKYHIQFQICTQSCRIFFYKDTFLDKKCQVYHNNTHVEAVSCNEEHSAICMYIALQYQKSSLCEQTHTICKQGAYRADSICFCETTSTEVGNQVLAEFQLPYQNLLFPNSSCRIGLQNTFKNSTNSFIWANSEIPINYTNWAPDVNFKYQYGLSTGYGWRLSDATPGCSLYQVNITARKGRLFLYIEDDSYKLLITNYKSFLSRNNSYPVVYCFTDADARSIVYRIKHVTEAYAISTDTYVMKFPPINSDQSGPGNYWCHAFLYPDFEVVESNYQMIANFSGEYVVLLRLKNYKEKLSSYPLTAENLETLQNLFKNELPNTISFYPRIFKINGIDEEKKEINITFHLTSAEAVSDKVEYDKLKAISMEQSMFEFLDFRHVYYCYNSTTQHGGQIVTWPRVASQQTATPLLNGNFPGHCVTANFTIIRRTCFGNFIDGMRWTEIEDFCHFYPTSSLTDKLIDISSQTDDNRFCAALSELLKISEEYESFNTLDFVLVVHFIMDVSVKKLDLGILAGIVSNLMKISRAVLLSAQLNFRATDILLESVETALENGGFGTWKKPNFAIVSVNISNGTTGYRVENCVNSSNCDITPITNPSVLYNQTFISTQNIDAAISLSTGLYEQIIEYSNSNKNYTPKLIVAIYYGSQLFVELEDPKSSKIVFGVLLPNFEQDFKGPVSVYYYTYIKSDLMDHNCSFWQFNEINSGSWSTEDTTERNEAVVCEFYHLTNFGLSFSFTASRTASQQYKKNGKKSDLQICIPGDEVAKKCFTQDQSSSEFSQCKTIKLGNPLEKYCLTQNFTLVPTNCFDNFPEEAYISNTLDNCTVHKLSDRMTHILGSPQVFKDDLVLELLLRLTANHSNINDVELLFVASFLRAVSNKTLDLAKLAGIVNNLMELPRTVLLSAQKKFKALDILINSIEQALEMGDCGEWKTNNFAIYCVYITQKQMGVILSNCSEFMDNCDFQVINRTSPLYNETFDSENMYAIIALSDILHNQILNYSRNTSYVPKLMVSVYYGSELFVDLRTNSPAGNLVFSVLLPNFKDIFKGPLILYYFNGSSFVQYNCSYWKFDDNTYGSWVTEASFLSNQAVICDFFHLTNFIISTKVLNNTFLFKDDIFYVNTAGSFSELALGLTEREFSYNTDIPLPNMRANPYPDQCNFNDYISNKINLQIYLNILHDLSSNNDKNKKTDDFTDYNTHCHRKSLNAFVFSFVDNIKILNSVKAIENLDESGREKIYKDADIQFVDRFLHLNDLSTETALKILEMIEASVISLDTLADIVSICMDKNGKIYVETSVQTTDKFLYNTDRLLQSFRQTSQVKRENVIFITVSKEDVQYFQGFFVTSYNDAICLFNDRESIEPNDNDIHVTVVINSELRKQIRAAKSSIIFVVFFSEVLFPVKGQSTIKLPIIEVLIPNIHHNLKGEISIKYKNTYSGICSYWDHEIVDNEIIKAGSWKKESLGINNGNSVTCNFQHVTHFALVASSLNITTDLEQILASNLTGLEKLKQVEIITTSNHNNLVPVDIYLISQIITSSLSEGAIPTVITRIISKLFMVPRVVLREAQETHSATDTILYAVDQMARMIDDLDIHHQNFSMMVKDLDNTNLTGIILHGCEKYKCFVDELDDFINISDYSENDSISAMVIFSRKLVDQIRNNSNSAKIAITVYYSDVLFNEVSNSRNTTKIFGVIFPGLTDVLAGTVSVIFNIGTMSTRDSSQCAYWHYKVDPSGNIDNATPGTWVNDTNKERKNKLAICNYSHVTHFGMLLANNGNYDNDPILDLITDIGCALSLFGILLILLTAMLFKKWRQNTGNKILINFSIAISVKIITLYISVYMKSTSSGISCTITGTILHYAILSECAWMLTVAILQFKRFVEVLGGPPKYVLAKAFICGWVFPIIPVICVIAIDPNNYQKGVANICYPSNLGLFLGVWLPVLLILTINCIIFTFIIYNVFHKKTECIDNSNHEILFQWRLALLLFFMLGINWAFGFLGQIKGDIVFNYLYSITASLQGFVLFLFFIVFNKSTRFLYSQSIKQWFYARGIFKVWQSKSKQQHKF